MKIKEIITETIAEGSVYGWIDPHGQEFQTEETTNLRHHNNVLKFLKSRGILGTEHWDDVRRMYPGTSSDEIDYISQALRDGWVRIGAIDHEFVFAQFSHKIANRPLNYLLRIILKFKPQNTVIDLMDDDGRPWNSKDFTNPRQAIAWIRKETGI